MGSETAFDEPAGAGRHSSNGASPKATIPIRRFLQHPDLRPFSSYTATDLNGNRGTQTLPEGAAEPIRLALLADDGPTGTYSDSKGIVPW